MAKKAYYYCFEGMQESGQVLKGDGYQVRDDVAHFDVEQVKEALQKDGFMLSMITIVVPVEVSVAEYGLKQQPIREKQFQDRMRELAARAAGKQLVVPQLTLQKN
jgi:hypothetical protein